MSTKAEQIAARIVRDVGELERCSEGPMMLVTPDELRDIVLAALDADRLDAVAVSDAMVERAMQAMGLPPGGDDPFISEKDVRAALEYILPIADEQRPREGSRVQWTNQLGNTFTGTVCVNISVTFDDGTWRLFTPDEFKQLRAIASAKGDDTK